MKVRDDEVLVRDPSYFKYDRLLSQAEAEGRLDGRYSCPLCGMRYRDKDTAEDCCGVSC